MHPLARMWGGGAPPIAILATDAGNVINNETTPTDLVVAIGGAEAGRHLIALVTNATNDGTSGSGIVTAITVDPAGAAIAMQKAIARDQNAGGETNEAGIWIADISAIAGTSVTVRIAYATAETHSLGLSTIAITRPRSAIPTSSGSGGIDSGTTTPTGTAVSGAPGGLIVAAAMSDDRLGAGWSGLTERADLQTGGGSHDHQHVAAWDLLPDGRAAAVETVTWAGTGGAKALAVAAFR
jgi:hypothetical protein